MTAVKKYNADQLMTVLLAPVVSEKSTRVADKNRQYVFRVADDATKPEVKAAVELLFKAKVQSVTVSNVKGKVKRFGRFMGRRRNWKKAYVRLAAGQGIVTELSLPRVEKIFKPRPGETNMLRQKVVHVIVHVYVIVAEVFRCRCIYISTDVPRWATS